MKSAARPDAVAAGEGQPGRAMRQINPAMPATAPAPITQ